MPIVAAAFLPPSPLLIPEIGKQNQLILQKTGQAYQTVAEILKAAETEVIIIISPHGSAQADNVSLNINPVLELSFREFGYLATIGTFTPALSLADRIREETDSDLPVRLISQKLLDYGSAVPLHLLNNSLAKIKVLPLFPAEKKDRAYHYQFGRKLGTILHSQPEKIAIIAVGDLSRRLKKNSPEGYSPKGARFDNRVVEYLNDAENGLNKILSIDDKLATEVLEGGLKQLSLLLGAIGDRYQPQILAYQNDFGTGYLSVNFNLQIAPI